MITRASKCTRILSDLQNKSSMADPADERAYPTAMAICGYSHNGSNGRHAESPKAGDLQSTFVAQQKLECDLWPYK